MQLFFRVYVGMARLRTSDMWIVLSVVSMSTLIIPTPVDGRPHMVVILADDLGWSDVGFRDSEMHTPNIDRMAAQGVMLNYSYMQQVCTPSRAAFLSGYYPFKIGMQNSVLNALEKQLHAPRLQTAARTHERPGLRYSLRGQVAPGLLQPPHDSHLPRL